MEMQQFIEQTILLWSRATNAISYYRRYYILLAITNQSKCYKEYQKSSNKMIKICFEKKIVFLADHFETNKINDSPNISVLILTQYLGNVYATDWPNITGSINDQRDCSLPSLTHQFFFQFNEISLNTQTKFSRGASRLNFNKLALAKRKSIESSKIMKEIIQ